MNDDTIYIVSGYMRSGTSMMMRALEAGGLEPAFSPSRDEMNTRFGDDDYKPNPNGFYELDRKEYQEQGFPRKYKGKLIKVLWGGVTRLAVAKYRVVFMLRNPEEIRQSYQAFFDGQAPNIKNYEAMMNDSIEHIRNRRDVVAVTVMRYREMVDHPGNEFQRLYEAGWPIDAGAAAATVDPKLCRFRLEKLTVGVY